MYILAWIISVLIYIITIVTLINTLKNNQKNLGKDIESLKKELGKDISLLKKIVFMDGGEMNLVTAKTCEKKEEAVYKRIKEEREITKQAFTNIQTIRGDLDRIILHMGIAT